MSTNVRPLPPSKKYHFNIIYNHEQSSLSATEDNEKSLEYAELAVSILTSEGLDKSYYHHRDARPGRSIFDEVFRLIEKSQFTLLIVTPGLIRNCWAKYGWRSTLKQYLDKEQDHRLIALAFNMTDNQIPQELCQYEVLHFKDTEDDTTNWTKLVKVMVEGDNVAVPEHNPITESGDNPLHTGLDPLMAHPEGETSLSLNSLNIDGDKQGSIASDGDKTKGANSSPGQTVLYQRVESLQVDGDDSVHGTVDGHHGQSAAQGTDSGLNAQRAAASVQNSGGPRPQQTKTSAAGDGEPNAMERELMTKEPLGQKPVTLDLKSPSPRPVAGYIMSLEASPTVSAPVVAKTLPPPSGVGKPGTCSNRPDGEKTPVQNAVHTQIDHTERLDNSSLTDDSDLTFDDGGTSQSVNDGATGQTEQKVLFNGNREENLGNLQLNKANTQSENTVIDSSARPAPEGEAADATFGDGGCAAGARGKSLSEDKQTRSSSYNWFAFTSHCVSRVLSTSDSMFTYWGKPK